VEAVTLERFLAPTLADAGFYLEEIREHISYQNRPAWVIYYRGGDCKLQILWSARDGGIDFYLAPIDAPNELGLTNESHKWHLMLLLSDVSDSLATPPPDARDEVEMNWLKALFETHFRAAHAALAAQG
jgi:hypothetical protein